VKHEDFDSLYYPSAESLPEIKCRIENLECQAPNYHLLGKTSAWVCPEAKPAKVYTQLLQMFSHPGETVLDFLSGGQGLRMCLLEEIECLSFCDSDRVRGFLQVYADSLRDIPKVNRFFYNSGVVERWVRPRGTKESPRHVELDGTGSDGKSQDSEEPDLGISLADIDRMVGTSGPEFVIDSVHGNQGFDVSEFDLLGQAVGSQKGKKTAAASVVQEAVAEDEEEEEKDEDAAEDA
jgi:hypothetical protein